MEIAQLVQAFQEYANSFSQGYLKHGKASDILMTIGQSPAIIHDEVRFLSYLDNCLEMEGFKSKDIELIMGWLYERF